MHEQWQVGGTPTAIKLIWQRVGRQKIITLANLTRIKFRQLARFAAATKNRTGNTIIGKTNSNYNIRSSSKTTLY
jgi:hypothetical protein